MAKINKNANLYDYKGNLISKAPLKKLSIADVENLVDELTKKAQENPDDEMYKVYLNNAQSFLYGMYNGMDRNELLSRLSALQDALKNAKEEVKEIDDAKLASANEALDELKKAVQDSKTEEPEDEYVEFEEVKDGE